MKRNIIICLLIVAYIPSWAYKTISLSPENRVIIPGLTLTLTATQSSGSQTVTWKSDNNAIATVTSAGKVTAVKEGVTSIRTTLADKTTNSTAVIVCAVNPAQPVSSNRVLGITLSDASKSLTKGSNYTINPTITPAEATNKKVIWSSTDPYVASVSASGQVTAHYPGKATIRAITDDGGYMATCKVTVNDTKQIVFLLKGGKKNPYDWTCKDSMFVALNRDYNAYTSATAVWTLPSESHDIIDGIPEAVTTIASDFFTSTTYKNKWGWLPQYLNKVTAEQGQVTDLINNPMTDRTLYLRYNLSAFFQSSQRTDEIITADYSTAGHISQFHQDWGYYMTYPIVIYERFVLPTPYRDGYSFLGWYDNSNYSGNALYAIPEGYTDTLYARWKTVGNDTAVANVLLEMDSINLTADSSATLNAHILPTSALNQTLTWFSSVDSVATVDNGVVTAHKPGTTVITATSVNGKSASCIVVVSGIEDEPTDPEEEEEEEEETCNAYGWETADDMYQALAADVLAAAQDTANYSFSLASTFVSTGQFGAPSLGVDISGISYDVQYFDPAFFNSVEYGSKWGWLRTYIDNRVEADSAVAMNLWVNESQYLRFNLAAFFYNGQSTAVNTTADYTSFGASSEQYYSTWGSKLCTDEPITPTDIEDIQSANLSDEAQKRMVNGVLYIIRNGKIFNALGMEVK